MLDNLTLPRKARRLAKELLKQAKENEPQITADLQNIAWEISGEAVGLENKFKAEMSLVRKLIDAVGDDLQRLQRKSKNINDVLHLLYLARANVFYFVDPASVLANVKLRIAVDYPLI